ncbi:hypothetical protein ABZ707_12590 [Streptomyces sp. NPDC006923]|uniref:hypothetical protein n=1 Tax=Streptomyces sp. NPDC006923 TaxID=3155355 RepID=UPI0033CC249B
MIQTWRTGGKPVYETRFGWDRKTLVPHLPADVVLVSRPVSGRRLDKDRLTAAVAHVAPAVPVVDAG